jgi:hypothetical protein
MATVLTTDGGRPADEACHAAARRRLAEDARARWAWRLLVRSTPRDLQRVRELRAGIGDPAVRNALDLLATCLGERFGGDIALGDGTGAISAGDATDIALGEDREK